MNINLTLFGQMISFAVFVLFTMKFIWPPIVKAVQERKAKIAEGLAAAERGHHEQELGQKRAMDIMRQAKAEASDVVAQAQKRAAEIIDEARTDARAEGDRLLVAARAEIERERTKVREELRETLASLVVSATEKILQKEIRVEDHRSLLDGFAKQI
jgi:F-type H+-transporting ATPase subunit b